MAKKYKIRETPKKIIIDYKTIEQKALRAKAVFPCRAEGQLHFDVGQEFSNIRILPNSTLWKATM